MMIWLILASIITIVNVIINKFLKAESMENKKINFFFKKKNEKGKRNIL
jgi:hypothetical protein